MTNIKSQMFSDAALKGASLDVTSKDGQVTLMGDVPSDAAHLEAYKIASQTPGVSKVDDQIVVQAVVSAQTTQPGRAAANSPGREVSKAHTEDPKRDRGKKSIRDSDVSQPESADNEPPPPPIADQFNGQQNSQSNGQACSRGTCASRGTDRSNRSLLAASTAPSTAASTSSQSR